MRAMRERQFRQLVTPGTFNAKLSPGALVDIEYLVQGLQITHGHADPSLRVPNTLEAIDALMRTAILDRNDAVCLREGYLFQRRMIGALRIVRGNARDLTTPAADTEEFAFLARRLGYESDLGKLLEEIVQHTSEVQEVGHRLFNRDITQSDD
jgi:glutamate-ammonia-ligase adenylyltransferase